MERFTKGIWFDYDANTKFRIKLLDLPNCGISTAEFFELSRNIQNPGATTDLNKMSKIFWTIFNSVLTDWTNTYIDEKPAECNTKNKKLLFDYGSLGLVKFVVEKAVQMAGEYTDEMFQKLPKL